MTSKVETLKRVVTIPPPYTRGSATANRLGLQPCRMVYEIARRAVMPDPQIEGELGEHWQTLDRDGVVAIPNFLDQADFEAVLAGAQEWHDSPDVNFHAGKEGPINRDHDKLDWVQGVLQPGSDDVPYAAPLFELFASDPRIETLVQTVMGTRRTSTEPALIYEHLSLPDDAVDDTDNLLILHADRHFPTAKVFFALASNGREEGAFEYCIGSHRVSKERLRFERDYATNCANLRSGRVDDVPPDALQNGRIGVPPHHWEQLGLSPTPIVAEPNTLIVANNRGFHRRGTISPGHARVQLRLIFHGFREPLVAPLVRETSKWLRR